MVRLITFRAQPQTQKDKFKECVSNCKNDAWVRAGASTLAGINPVSGIAYAAVDIATGGINPFGAMAGTSSFMGNDRGALMLIGNVHEISANAHSLTGYANNIGPMASRAGAGMALSGGEAAWRAGRSVRSLGKIVGRFAKGIPLLGHAITGVQLYNDLGDCENKCAGAE